MSLCLGLCGFIQSAWSHAWKGQEVVLFVTYDLSGQDLKATVGLPVDLAFTTNKLPLKSLQYVKKSLAQKSLTVLPDSRLIDLRHRVQRDLKVLVNGKKKLPTLNKVDLILTHPSNSINNQARLVRFWEKTQIETHSGTQNAMIVTLTYPIASVSKLENIHFVWQSTDWFIKSKTTRIHRLRKRLTSKSVSGLIIDKKEITPITFTPTEPEVIWRSPQDFVSMMKYSSSQVAKKSWWTKFKNLFWSSSADYSHSELAEVFTSLHRRIYSAFDKERDEEAYHALSLVLSGDMLDEVFQSTYQALILRDQGGAKAKVTHVIPLTLDVLKKSDLPSRFSKDLTSKGTSQVYFRYQWRVVGQVNHWGHSHRRVNDYKALYAMSRLQDKWKLTAVHPLFQTRRPELEGAL